MTTTSTLRRVHGTLALAFLTSAAGCTSQPTAPPVEEELAVPGPGEGGALAVAGTAVHIVPVANQNAPQGSVGVEVHRQRGGSVPRGTAILTDEGPDLRVQVDISGLIPHPGEYSDLYTLRLRGHGEGTVPVDCTGRPYVDAVFSERASDGNGELHGSFVVPGRSVSDVGVLELLWDELPIACGPVM